MLKVKEKAKCCPRPNPKHKGILMSGEGAIRITESEKSSQPIQEEDEARL